jgi:hypothetical protein
MHASDFRMKNGLQILKARLRENVGSTFRHAPDQRGEPRVHLGR